MFGGATVMHLDDVILAGNVFEDLVEPVSMLHEADGSVVVNLDRSLEEAVPHPLDVLLITAIPIACLQGFDGLDRFEAGDTGFEIVHDRVLPRGRRWGQRVSTLRHTKHGA